MTDSSSSHASPLSPPRNSAPGENLQPGALTVLIGRKISQIPEKIVRNSGKIVSHFGKIVS